MTEFLVITRQLAVNRILAKFAALLFLFAVFCLLLSAKAFAQTTTIEVSGNGDSSQNSVNLKVVTQTQVESTNQAEVNNNVETEANSGANSANNNAGDGQITTGDVSQKVDVENNVNTNVISVNDCGGCGANLEIKNSGNGANSQNSVTTNVNTQIDIKTTNIAKITNNVKGKAITGKNTANNNIGNGKIDTGNAAVKVNGGIVNSVNKTAIVVDPAGSQKIKILNIANGVNSINGINVQISNAVNVEKIDFLVVENNILWDIITGENSCNNNVGGCSITTGDIDASFAIENLANVDVVFVGAPTLPIGEPSQPLVPTQPGVQPPAAPSAPPSQPGPTGPAGPTAPGEVLAAAISELPVTGAGNLIYLLILWLSLLLTGVVLRSIGSRSPPVFIKI